MSILLSPGPPPSVANAPPPPPCATSLTLVLLAWSCTAAIRGTGVLAWYSYIYSSELCDLGLRESRPSPKRLTALHSKTHGTLFDVFCFFCFLLLLERRRSIALAIIITPSRVHEQVMHPLKCSPARTVAWRVCLARRYFRVRRGISKCCWRQFGCSHAC